MNEEKKRKRKRKKRKKKKINGNNPIGCEGKRCGKREDEEEKWRWGMRITKKMKREWYH